MKSFDITDKTRKGKLPRLPFEQIKNHLLGKKYDLSLVFIGDKSSRNLNKKYRKKDYPTNVLSFPIDKDSGEIFINLRKTEREAKNYGHSVKKHVAYLFIHGLLHLKGMDHGSTMESTEKKVLKKFGF